MLTNGTRDSGLHYSAYDVGATMTVEIARTAGVWRVRVNGVDRMPNTEMDGSGTAASPTFLDGVRGLVAGVFAFDAGGRHKQLLVDRFVVRVATPHD